MNTRPLILSAALAICVLLALLLSVQVSVTTAQPAASVSRAHALQPYLEPAGPQETPSKIIRGQVIGGRAGLRVQVLRPDGRVVDETRTVSDGWFDFPSLPAGHYKLRVLNEDGQPLALAANAQVEVWPEHAYAPVEYNLPLAPESPAQPASILANGYITGIVTAADTGLPESDVSVRIYNDSGSLRTTRFPDFFTGVYSASVPPGIYRVKFEPSFSIYAPEWYDNRRDFASAAQVVVSDSAVTPNINAALEVGGQIAGRVTAASGGAPLNNATVYAYMHVTSTNYVAYDNTNSSGVYTITGLLTGTYYLKFDPPFGSDYLVEYYNDKPSLATADGVPVTLGGVTSGIDAAL